MSYVILTVTIMFTLMKTCINLRLSMQSLNKKLANTVIKSASEFKGEKMIYKIGDTIQFKTWEELIAEFGKPDNNGIINTKQGFREDMKFLCGTKNFITDIENDYFIKCCGVGREYCITDDVIRVWNFNEDKKSNYDPEFALEWLVWFARQKNDFVNELMPNIYKIYKMLRERSDKKQNDSFKMAVTQMVELGKEFLIQKILKSSKLNRCCDRDEQRELEDLYYNEIAATANVIRLFTERKISFQWRKGANGEDWGGFTLYEIMEDAPCFEIPCGVSDTTYSRYSGKQEKDRRINWGTGIEQGKIIKIYELVYDKSANPVYVGGYCCEI